MTCKDCIHYVVCEFEFFRRKYEKIPYGIDADDCHHFKDKSKIIELPCKFGDTAYMVYHFNIGNVDEVIEGNIEQVIIDKRIWFKAFFERSYWKSFNVEDIGKTIFLTREEAEKALKELNK